MVIIFIGFEMLLREFQTRKMKPSKVVLVMIGVLSGLLCGLYGIGALLGAYINRVTDNSSSFKANMKKIQKQMNFVLPFCTKKMYFL